MKNRLKVGWAEILTRNPETKEMGTLIGNIREVHDNYSEVEISIESDKAYLTVSYLI